MTPICEQLRRAKEDGDSAYAAELREHLRVCGTCREHDALLRTFDSIAPAEASEPTVARVMAALPVAPWQQRHWATWLPFAAALALVGVGFGLLGGLPAGSFVFALPGATGGALSWFASWLLDVVTVARGGADAAQVALSAAGLWFVAWLMAVVLGGGWAAFALARRRHTDS